MLTTPRQGNKDALTKEVHHQLQKTLRRNEMRREPPSPQRITGNPIERFA